MNDGAVSEMGSFEELLQRKGDFAEFINTYLTEAGIEHVADETGGACLLVYNCLLVYVFTCLLV